MTHLSILCGPNPHVPYEEINMLLDLSEDSVNLLTMQTERERFKIVNYLGANDDTEV